MYCWKEGVIKGTLQDWQLTIEQSIPMAASVATEDTVKFIEFHSMGSNLCCFTRKAFNQENQTTKEGWVSCGSFLFPYKAIRLDSLTSLVMPERELAAVCIGSENLYTRRNDNGRHH